MSSIPIRATIFTMILFHITKYNLGKAFRSNKKICCAPTISHCILGLQDFIHYKNSGRKNIGPIYIYRCNTTKFNNGKEFDSHITKEKIVHKGVDFTLVGTINKNDVQYLDDTLKILHEAHSHIHKNKKTLTQFYNVILSFIQGLEFTKNTNRH